MADDPLHYGRYRPDRYINPEQTQFVHPWAVDRWSHWEPRKPEPMHSAEIKQERDGDAPLAPLRIWLRNV